MTSGPVLLDSDTLSELSRGRPSVVARAADYLERHGRLTVSAVSIVERLRGYRLALRLGKPFQQQLRQFETLAATCIVLPVDAAVADRAATIWAQLGARARRAVGDVLIAATASAYRLPLVTRNRRDFEPMSRIEGVRLAMLDWSR
jgi:predicted nucleic acid-binding protein